MYFFIFQTVRSLIFSLFRHFVPSNPCTLIQLVPVYLNTTTFRHVIFCNDTLFTIFSSFSHILDSHILVVSYRFASSYPYSCTFGLCIIVTSYIFLILKNSHSYKRHSPSTFQPLHLPLIQFFNHHTAEQFTHTSTFQPSTLPWCPPSRLPKPSV